MRYHPFVRPVPREYHSISSWTASSVDLVVVENREFVVRARVWESEALIVVILMGIFVAAHGFTILVVAVALLYSGINVGLVVACGTTGLDTLALKEVSRKKWSREEREFTRERELARAGAARPNVKKT